MSPAKSELYSVQTIPGAGRGVISSQRISKDTLVLQSQRPAAHVLHWEYRKETCAQCFYYNLGRVLPVRLHSTGKTFCTSECEHAWRQEHGEIGVTAWERLHAFITSKASAITNAHGLPTLGEKPHGAEIEAVWSRAADEVKQMGMSSGQRKKKGKVPKVPMGAVDPYILYYLLSGVLFHYHHPEKWQEDVASLAMNDKPYQSSRDLEAHCNSFIQLASFLPTQLLPNLTATMCQILISTASYNGFGIHFGNEGEEYMGYALYPEASYFNHSCAPNIGKTRMADVWHFAALRDIAEGEECCITYLGGDEKTLSVVARRARLRQHWGFECMCMRCVEESQGEEQTSST